MSQNIYPKTLSISGYAVVTERKSNIITQNGKKFQEIMSSGIFGRLNPAAILLKYNHKRVIGKITNLFEDNIGLQIKATITDPEVIKLALEGKLKGYSIGFRNTIDKWDNSGKIPIRQIIDLTLDEVSVVGEGFNPLHNGTMIKFDGLTVEQTAFLNANKAYNKLTLPIENASEINKKPAVSLNDRFRQMLSAGVMFSR